jgi:signal transduction histidine kinase
MEDLLTRTLGGMVRIETSLQDGLWLALVDATQVEMILLNLAINARDAMTPNGGPLRISTANVPAGSGELPNHLAFGEYVRLAVADEGSGMTEEVRSRAFDPFFTTKDIGKGTGLGLSQVYGVVAQLGGTVTIESAPGRGTTVRVYLPRTEDVMPAEPTPAA